MIDDLVILTLGLSKAEVVLLIHTDIGLAVAVLDDVDHEVVDDLGIVPADAVFPEGVTHLREYNTYVNSGEYSASGAPNKLVPVYHDLSGKTWGIIGLGNIGRAVAKVATALGARVIANKRTPVSDYECVDIDTLCHESDIITVHCPLNEESRNLINKERIALMKKDVVIVNVARGAVVNDEDITDAIKKGMIGAFGADVYTTEPFSNDHPFYEIKDFANVLFTPHAAWGSYEARTKCINIICDNISSFLSGKSKNRIV